MLIVYRHATDAGRSLIKSPKEGMEAMASTIPKAATGPRAMSTHRSFISALLLAQSPEGYMSLCRTIVSARRPRYRDIRCSLLVLAGSHDQTSSLQDCREILQRSLLLLYCASFAASNAQATAGEWKKDSSVFKCSKGLATGIASKQQTRWASWSSRLRTVSPRPTVHVYEWSRHDMKSMILLPPVEAKGRWNESVA